MNKDLLIRVKEIISEAETLGIKEIEKDIRIARRHNFDISRNDVTKAFERIKIFLIKNNREDLAQEIAGLQILSQRKNNLHTGLIKLAKEIRDTIDVESDVLDYIISSYQGIVGTVQATDKHNKMFDVVIMNNLASNKMEEFVNNLHSEYQIRLDGADKLLREYELEVLLMSTLLFSTNRAYLGKIDHYLEHLDDPRLKYELTDILESDVDNRTIKLLDANNIVADDSYENLDDIEEYAELVPEDMNFDEAEILNFNEYNLANRIVEEFERNQDPLTSEYKEAEHLAKCINREFKGTVRGARFGANEGILVEAAEDIKEVDPILITRFIRNSLAHHAWRFTDDGYVHMWRYDKDKLIFNIKLPVEILYKYIYFFLKTIFSDVKYLTIFEFNGNYPTEYLDMSIEEILDDLIRKGVILKREKSELLAMAKTAIEVNTSFYTEEYQLERAKYVLEYFLKYDKSLTKKDKIEIQTQIDKYLEDYLDLNIDDILENMTMCEINYDPKIAEKLYKEEHPYDMDYQSIDESIKGLDFLLKQVINPRFEDYLLIADFVKYFDSINSMTHYEKDVDLFTAIPSDLETHPINENIRLKLLITTLLTLIFVHTDINEELLEIMDFSTIKLTKKGKEIYSKDLKQKRDDLAEGARNESLIYKTNIAKLEPEIEALKEKIERKKTEGKKTKKEEEALERKNTQLQRNKDLLAAIVERLRIGTDRINSSMTNPVTLYSSTTIFGAIRNSLAHGNIIIPNKIDPYNLDELEITIVDKNPENENELTFEGKIKLGELLKQVCKPEIMIPTFNLDTRFGKEIPKPRIPEVSVTEETKKTL